METTTRAESSEQSGFQGLPRMRARDRLPFCGSADRIGRPWRSATGLERAASWEASERDRCDSVRIARPFPPLALARFARSASSALKLCRFFWAASFEVAVAALRRRFRCCDRDRRDPARTPGR